MDDAIGCFKMWGQISTTLSYFWLSSLYLLLRNEIIIIVIDAHILMNMLGKGKVKSLFYEGNTWQS